MNIAGSRTTEYVAAASGGVGHHGAPIRFGFIGNDHSDSSGRIPPLARLIRAGRSGEVPLKLQLSLLWLASTKTLHQVKYLAHVWAVLLGLESPTTNGARRVKGAIGALERHRLIAVEHRRGTANVLTLLDERGEGQSYQHPGKSGGYIQLPATFWTNFWLHELSPPALAIFLVVLVELFRYERVECWLSESQARRRYLLSADTWTRGVRELRDRRLITVGRDLISANPFEDPGRYRNTYRLRAAAGAKESNVSRERLKELLEATLVRA